MVLKVTPSFDYSTVQQHLSTFVYNRQLLFMCFRHFSSHIKVSV